MRAARGGRKIAGHRARTLNRDLRQALILLPVVQVRMLVALARHAPLDGYALSSGGTVADGAGGAAARAIRHGGAGDAAGRAEREVYADGRGSRVGARTVASCSTARARVQRIGALSPFGFTIRHHERWVMRAAHHAQLAAGAGGVFERSRSPEDSGWNDVVTACRAAGFTPSGKRKRAPQAQKKRRRPDTT
jgi:hypothetical protein